MHGSMHSMGSCCTGGSQLPQMRTGAFSPGQELHASHSCLPCRLAPATQQAGACLVLERIQRSLQVRLQVWRRQALRARHWLDQAAVAGGEQRVGRLRLLHVRCPVLHRVAGVVF